MRAFADRQYRIRRSSAQRRSIRGKLGRKTWRRLVSHFLTNCRRVRRFSEVPWKYCFRRSKYRRPTSGRLGPISGQRIEVVDPPRVSTILSFSLSRSFSTRDAVSPRFHRFRPPRCRRTSSLCFSSTNGSGTIALIYSIFVV